MSNGQLKKDYYPKPRINAVGHFIACVELDAFLDEYGSDAYMNWIISETNGLPYHLDTKLYKRKDRSYFITATYSVFASESDKQFAMGFKTRAEHGMNLFLS